MKFYGLEIGCTKVLKAEKGYEVIAVTTFGEDTTEILVNSIRTYATKSIHEGEYVDCPKTSPEVSVVKSLSQEKWRTHHTYHYLVANYLVKPFLNTLHLKLPSNEYIALDNND